MCSTRPQDCNTAAYLLQLYIQAPNAHQDMTQFATIHSINITHEGNNKMIKYIIVV